MPFAVLFQALIDRLRHLPQRQFAQRNQVRLAEKILQRAPHPLLRIHVAAPHAVLQRLRSQIDHHHFVDALQHPVGHGFPHLDPRNPLHGRRHALQVLDVHRGKNVDARVQQFEHIFVPLAMLAAFDVGVGQFVDQRDARLARKDRIHIHLFEDRSLVFDRFARNHFQIRDQLGHGFAAMSFHHADHHILAPGVPPDRLRQHGVRLADSRERIQEKA